MSEGPGFWATLRADMVNMEMTRTGYGAMLAAFFMRLDFPAVFLFRASALLRGKGWLGRAMAFVCWRLNAFMNGCDIRPEAQIAPGLSLPHPVGVVIGPVQIGRNVVIHQSVTMGRSRSGDAYDGPSSRPVVGDDVTIYAGAVIVGGVRIGDKAQIGANAVVVADVPAGATAFTPPARCLPPKSSVQ